MPCLQLRPSSRREHVNASKIYQFMKCIVDDGDIRKLGLVDLCMIGGPDVRDMSSPAKTS